MMINTTLRRSSSSVTPGAAILGVAASVAAVGAALSGGTARAQVVTSGLPVGTPSVLPATGTGVRVGSLRDQVSSLLASGPVPGAGESWIITPSIGVDVGATDNALQASSPRRADFFTLISPAISITGDTARLKVNATYSPIATIFAQTSGRTRVDQYLAGDALATVVPDLFYVDLRANITQSSITGGFGPYGSRSLNGQDQVQTSSVSLTPYLIHRFDGYGTGTLSYSFAYTAQNGNDNGAFATPFGTTTTVAPFSGNPNSGSGVNSAFLGNQELITNREFAQFTSGENLGRTNLTAAVELQQYSGSGIYSGAYRNLYTVSGAYAVTRSIALIGQIGYENLRYSSLPGSGLPAFELNSPVYQVGVRWTPNPRSTVTVAYGRRDGVDSPFVEVSYEPTARTRIYGSYSAGLTSAAEDQQNLLRLANFAPGGLATSSLTGAPLVTTGDAFGTQNTLYRLRRLTVTGVLLRPRDTYSVSVVHQDEQVIQGVGLFTGNGSYGGTYGQLSWQHDISPVLSSGVYLQYGTDTTQAAGFGNANFGNANLGNGNTDEQFATANAGLYYAISATLSGRVSYTVSSRFGSKIPGRDYVENIVLVGLRKGF